MSLLYDPSCDLMPNCSAPQKVVPATFVPLPERELRQGNADIARAEELIELAVKQENPAEGGALE